MAIILNDNLKINAGKPIDSRYLTTGNTIYISTTAVNAAIPTPLRYTGLTVNILGNEYWYKNGVSGTSLVLKVPTGGTAANAITGATNIGFFSGQTSIQTLAISTSSGIIGNYLDYSGNYSSLYNYYYRGVDQKIHIGTPNDNIVKRGYVKTVLPIESWIWNQYTGSSNHVGWIFVQGDISLKIGQTVNGVIYYTGSSQVYTETAWSAPANNGGKAVINSVLGSLTTGTTISIGGPVFATKTNNVLNFRTIMSKTPSTLNISSDEAFIYLSGTTQINHGVNIGSGIGIYAGLSGTSLQFRSIIGSGNTTIGLNGNTIAIYSSGTVDIITGATNGLNINGKNIQLGGTITIPTIFIDNRIIPTGIEYNSNYDATFSSRSLVDKAYVDAVAAGLVPKLAVEVATTSNIILTGISTIDGVIITTGMRVLVKNQISGQTNGIYVVNSGGTWSRSTDFNFVPSGEVVQGVLVPVISGNTQKNTLWVLVTPNPIISGITSMSFGLFSSSNFIAGTGINIAGSTISTDNLTQSIVNTAITGATNGLTKISNRKVCLGGTLSDDVIINLNSCKINFINGSVVSCGATGRGFDSYNDYKLSGNTILSIPSRNFSCGNLAVGYQALCNNTTGKNNVAIGTSALFYNTSGYLNTAIGTNALLNNINGNNNTGIGNNVLSNNICGYYNVGIGNGALYCNLCGSLNIAIGVNTLYYNTGGTSNIAIGKFALNCNCGFSNIAIGESALQLNTVGTCNIAIGSCALYSNIIGCTNIAIGSGALCYNTIGNNNIAIGQCAGYYETGSSKLYIANSYTTHPLIYGDFSINCAIIYGAFKTSGATSLLVAPVAGTTSDAILVWNSSDKLIKIVPNISGGTGGGDKNNIYSKTIITGNTLLITGSTYVILASGTSITITLPTTPLNGQTFKIKDAYGNALTNNIIINAGSGRTIDGSQCALINTNYGALELMFGTTCKWFILGFIN
jgi:hypothetical protein